MVQYCMEGASKALVAYIPATTAAVPTAHESSDGDDDDDDTESFSDVSSIEP